MQNLDSNIRPSKVTDTYWIESTSPIGTWSMKSGKWLLFIPVSRIDNVWKIIDMETRSGRLGIAAKVATAMSNPLATNSRVRLICIYTYDCTDLVDVRRVREETS